MGESVKEGISRNIPSHTVGGALCDLCLGSNPDASPCHRPCLGCRHLQTHLPASHLASACSPLGPSLSWHKAFAHAIPSAWNTLPCNLDLVKSSHPPSPCSDFMSSEKPSWNPWYHMLLWIPLLLLHSIYMFTFTFVVISVNCSLPFRT